MPEFSHTQRESWQSHKTNLQSGQNKKLYAINSDIRVPQRVSRLGTRVIIANVLWLSSSSSPLSKKLTSISSKYQQINSQARISTGKILNSPTFIYKCNSSLLQTPKALNFPFFPLSIYGIILDLLPSKAIHISSGGHFLTKSVIPLKLKV